MTDNVSNSSKQEASSKLLLRSKKIFVGGISWDTNEADLTNFFSTYGEVLHVQIKYDHYTGRSRGFAFVEFATVEGCKKALEMKNCEIKGKKCELKPAKSRENKKIFVGGLPSDFSLEELRFHFEKFGKVDEIEWPFDKFQNKRKNFAFIVFEDDDAAQSAANEPKQRFGDRMCDVKIAVPQYMRPQKQMSMAPTWPGGWGDYTGYGYGGYGGGYGYYDDCYNYDYPPPPPAGGYPDYAAWAGNVLSLFVYVYK
ncbi:unnamed protein product [Soboliphyme baturini]|uniref:RRM domain-containing protein n=1 Tax=Soboliphyme baturini TaxID=241478 RepID=A0A183IP36_9BILA|nr:unnamed protein product [Soboliphyme baturini]